MVEGLLHVILEDHPIFSPELLRNSYYGERLKFREHEGRMKKKILKKK